jgi:uncharacterized protein YqgV (UPF0045/DUF77 family)
MAYRWGQLNAHSYIVTSGTDLNTMILAAEEECQDRGGKYGVSVIRTNTDSNLNINHEQVKYFHSLYEEEAPFYEHSIDIDQRIGRMIIEAVKNGKTHLMPTDGSSVMRYESVDIPEWLVNEVKIRIQEE